MTRFNRALGKRVIYQMWLNESRPLSRPLMASRDLLERARQLEREHLVAIDMLRRIPEVEVVGLYALRDEVSENLRQAALRVTL